jgi:hypothetical protein
MNGAKFANNYGKRNNDIPPKSLLHSSVETFPQNEVIKNCVKAIIG